MANRILLIPTDQSKGLDAASALGLTTPDADNHRILFEVGKRFILASPNAKKDFLAWYSSPDTPDEDILWALAYGITQIVDMADKELALATLAYHVSGGDSETIQMAKKRLAATEDDVKDIRQSMIDHGELFAE